MGQTMQGDRIVVTGYSAGSHFPRKHDQIPVRYEANGLQSDGPFDLQGAVYGRDLRFVGPGTAHGPILGRGDALLMHLGPGHQSLLSGIGVTGNLMSAPAAIALQQSAAGGLANVRHVLRGDIIARNITLQNAIVFGNLEANSIDLTTCVVFGAVAAREKLTCRASTLLYYHAPQVTFEGPCMMVNAMGESQEAPVFAPYQDGAGVVWHSEVRYYPVLRAMGYSALFWRPWNSAPESARQSLLYPGVDWMAVPVEQRQEDNATDVTLRHVLSVGGRALDYGRLEQHLHDLCGLLQAGLEFAHYDADTRARLRQTWQSLPRDERYLMECVSRVGISEGA